MRHRPRFVLLALVVALTSSIPGCGDDDGGGGTEDGGHLATTDASRDDDGGGGAPIAEDDTASVERGESVDVDVLDNDVGDALDPVTLVIVEEPASGSVEVVDGRVRYTHDGTEGDADRFTYTVSDASGRTSNEASVEVTIVDTPTAPVVADDAVEVAEGGTVDVAVLDNDAVGPLGFDEGSLTVVSAPAHGSVAVQPDGSVRYTHDGSETTSDSFRYTVASRELVSDEGVVTITITPVNDAPVATDDVGEVDEGGTVTLALTSNDTDVDGTLSAAGVVITMAPAHGTLVLAGDAFVYTHDGSESTSDLAQYTVRDEGGAVSNVASIALTIRPVDDAPQGVSDAVVVDEGGTVTFDPFANDVDPDSAIDPTSFVVVSAPAHGVAMLAGAMVTFTHDGSETTSDAFAYTITDAEGATSAPIAVSVTVVPVNDAPVAVGDVVTVAEGATVALELLANDVDVDSALTTAGITITRAPAHGTVALTGGVWRYTHDGSETTSDSFHYTVTDPSGASSGEAPVTITITPVNDPPVAVDDTITTEEDTLSAPLDVTSNDSDAEGPLTLVSVTQGAHGTVTFSGSQVRYQPSANFYGVDAFTYVVRDADGATATATVTVTITPVNDAPVAAQTGPFVTRIDTPATFVVFVGTDVEGFAPGAAGVSITAAPSAGSLVVNADRTVRYVPPAGFRGTVTFRYRLVDAAGAVSNEITASIEVGCVVRVGYLPGWAVTHDSNSSLGFVTLTNEDSTFGACEIEFTSVSPGFTLETLTPFDLIFISDASGGGRVYSASEAQAIRAYLTGGHGGAVGTFLFLFQSSSNLGLIDLFGIASGSMSDGSTSIATTMTVVDGAHPVTRGLGATFPSSSYASEQASPGGWTAADLANSNARYVVQGAGQASVIAHDAETWRTVYTTSMVEYQSSPGSRRLLYNAIVWAAQKDWML